MDSPRAAVSMDSPKASALEFGVWNKLGKSLEKKEDTTISPTVDERELLLSNLKMQVKQIMEEAVTRKFIHEESSTVISLCAAIEACLMCGLRRQVSGFFRTPTSWDLLCKVANTNQCAAAQQVHQRVLQEQQGFYNSTGSFANRVSSLQRLSGPRRAPHLSASASSANTSSIFSSNDSLWSGGTNGNTSVLTRFFRDSGSSSLSEEQAVESARMNYNATQCRYLWIRVALCQKHLCSILEYVMQNSNKYYIGKSVVADPCFGGLLLNLLVGPSALDYTKMKTGDHLWSDPPADELVQRHQLQYGVPAMRMDSTTGGHGLSIVGGIHNLQNSKSPNSTPPRRHRLRYFSQRTSSSSRSSGVFSSGNTTTLMCSMESSSVKTVGTMNGINVQMASDKAKVTAGRRCHTLAASSLSSIPSAESNFSPNTFRRYQMKPSLRIRSFQSTKSEESNYPNGHHGGKGLSAKDYIEALHQNSKSVNIYGKNNVRVQPHEDAPLMPGYLGLHSSARGLFVQWIPNQLMSSYNPINATSASGDEDFNSEADVFWEYALTIHIQDIVYIHCHQQGDHSGTVVFVDIEGVQRPPFHFPSGASNITTFLSHLETALMPTGCLEPPVWKKGRQKARKLKNGCASVTSTSPVCRSPAHRSNTKGRTRANSMEHYHEDSGSYSSDNNPTSWKASKLRALSRFSTRTVKVESEPSDNDAEEEQDEEEETMDRIFRVVYPQKSNGKNKSHPIDPTVEPWLEIVTKNEQNGDHFSANSWYSWQPQYTTHTMQTRTAPKTLQKRDESSEQVSSSSNRPYIKQLYTSMRKQILSRAFHGWLSYCRHMKDIRQHLHDLVRHDSPYGFDYTTMTDEIDNLDEYEPLNEEMWVNSMNADGQVTNVGMILHSLYFGGCCPSLRKEVWPFLLQHHQWDETYSQRHARYIEQQQNYERLLSEWLVVEAIARHREIGDQKLATKLPLACSELESADYKDDKEEFCSGEISWLGTGELLTDNYCQMLGRPSLAPSDSKQSLTSLTGSSTSHEGGVFMDEVIHLVSVNLHRIDKDVARCDRTYEYFQKANCPLGVTVSPIVRSIGSGTGNSNLDKLRNIMCTYVWEHLQEGYVQGMCDLLAPLLVILDDEALTHACFCRLMTQMRQNFTSNEAPVSSVSGNGMDICFAHMRTLVQILDPGLLEHMQRTGDYTHFYFSYRWFLLNFKREFKYEDVFRIWETVWVARELTTDNFHLFVALALLLCNRNIIIENEMDFTDIIRFFNERAEKHDVSITLHEARNCVHHLQLLLGNK